MENIDEMYVFDGMRLLLDRGIDLDDRAAVEAVLGDHYGEDPHLHARYVTWCIKAAKAKRDAGRLERHAFAGGSGFVPAEDDGDTETAHQTESIEAVLTRAGFVLSHKDQHEATYARDPERVYVQAAGWRHQEDVTAWSWSLAAGHGAAELAGLLGTSTILTERE